MTSYRPGHYWLLVVDRSFACALGLVKAVGLLLCVAGFRCRHATCCLLLFEVEAGGAFSSASSNCHCINTAECPLKAPFKRTVALTVVIKYCCSDGGLHQRAVQIKSPFN